MLITAEQIQKDLDLEPLRPFPTTLPVDPFERFSSLIVCYFPPCHPDLAFLIRLFTATHYQILKPNEIPSYWQKRSSLTKNHQYWDYLPAGINWYLPSLPSPQILQLVVILRDAYQYSRKTVDPKLYFSYLNFLASMRTAPLTKTDIELLQILKKDTMISLSKLAQRLNIDKPLVTAMIRRLRKSHALNIYNKIHYQNIGLDDLFVLIPHPNINYSSSFPSYSVPYFGENIGTQIGLRIPVGVDSIWVQKQFVTLAERLGTTAQIYRIIDHRIFLNFDTYSQNTSLWGLQQNKIPPFDLQEKGEAWTPRPIHRVPLSRLEYSVLLKHPFGIPIGGNRDSSHPILLALKQ